MSKLMLTNKKTFGHTHIFTGYQGDIPYLNYKDGKGVIDGIDRQHINLYARCDVCNKEFLLARIHVDKDGQLYGNNKKIDQKPKL